MHESLLFTHPDESYLAEIAAYRQDFLLDGSSIDGAGSLEKTADPTIWLRQVESLKRPETTPAKWVPSTQFMLVRQEDRRILGMLQIRHTLNDFLRDYGGHIGYSVRPGERRKGYATLMLANSLPYCRKLEISRVLITCAVDNPGSRKAIQNNQGIYESTVHYPNADVYLERWWISLS